MNVLTDIQACWQMHREMDIPIEVPTDIQMHKHTSGHMDVGTTDIKMDSRMQRHNDSQYTCHKMHLNLYLKCKTFSLFKANFLYLKELKKGVRCALTRYSYGGKNMQIVLKSTPGDTHQTLSTI